MKKHTVVSFIVLLSITWSLPSCAQSKHTAIIERLYRGDMTMALVYLEEGLVEHPVDDFYVFYKGVCHFNVNQYEKSLNCFSVIGDSSAYAAPALLYRAKIEDKLGDRNRAIQHLRQILSLSTSNQEAALLLLELLCKEKRFAEAFSLAEQRNDTQVWLTLGNYCLDNDRLTEALTIRQCLLDTTNTDLRLFSANCLLQNAQPDSALPEFMALLSTLRMPFLHLKISRCFEMLHTFRPALDHLRRSIPLSADSSPALLADIGRIYYSLDQYDSALVCFHKALAQDSNSVHLHYNLGLTYYQKADFALAERHCKKTVQYQHAGMDMYFSTLFSLGVIAYMQKKYNTAISYLHRMEESGVD